MSGNGAGLGRSGPEAARNCAQFQIGSCADRESIVTASDPPVGSAGNREGGWRRHAGIDGGAGRDGEG